MTEASDVWGGEFFLREKNDGLGAASRTTPLRSFCKIKLVDGLISGPDKTGMDKITAEKRSWNMSRIKSRDTLPERKVRSLLHRLGYRFSLKRRDLPGYPDVAMPKHQAAIFVHGCFWHRHDHCRNAVLPKTRPEFWLTKLNANVARDRRNQTALRQMGWKVLTIWECEVEDEPKLARKLHSKLAERCHA